MSNRRNPRRARQRIRAELRRKPVVITKAMASFIDGQAGERARKAARARDVVRAREREKWWQRYLRTPRKERKPRTVYGRTFWNHSNDA